MKINIDQNDEDIGKRLDLYLSIRLPQYSRSFIKKTIEENKVNINDELCYKAGYKVKGGDLIEFPDHDQALPVITNLTPSIFDLEIIFEDEDYMFINKPINLIVHPTNPSQKDTLVNKLLSLSKELPQNHFLRPGIVHRLDKDTSGVIIIAKNPKALWWVTGQFAERKVKKEYISVGLNTDLNFRYKAGDIFEYESFMLRSSRDRKQYISQKGKPENTNKGRFSKSKFLIDDVIKIKEGINIIQVKIYPMTGRTHQIRVHQKDNGFPILGDPIYLSEKQKEISESLFKKFKVDKRLLLHAHTVTFENYNRKVYSISAQIPDQFQYVIREAKKTKE